MPNIKKVSFQFPDYPSLWSFKDKTRAIHVSIEPRKNRISGLFEPKEIEMAVKDYNAVQHTGNNSETNDV